MNKTKLSKSKWCCEHVTNDPVTISQREYHMRLEQMMAVLYTELSQLPQTDLISSSIQMLDETNPGLIPEEAFDGVA